MRCISLFRSIWMLGCVFLLAACQTVPEPPLRAGLTPEQVVALEGEGFYFTEDDEAMALDLSGRMLFELNSFEIPPEAQLVISRITNTLLTIGITSARLDGHADNLGNPAYNLELSRQRAQAVAEEMAVQGFDPASIDIRALGDTRPIASNDTEEGRSANRRVSLVVSGQLE